MANGIHDFGFHRRDELNLKDRIDIFVDDLSGSEVAALLSEHLRNMAELSPPESVHALNLDALRKPDITFWTAWRANRLLGCGALKVLSSEHGEIKSMRTVREHLRSGVASALLQHIIGEAQQRGYSRLSLETGSMAGFAPARALYAQHGFTDCGPFSDYKPDPNSHFMTRELNPPHR